MQIHNVAMLIAGLVPDRMSNDTRREEGGGNAQ